MALCVPGLSPCAYVCPAASVRDALNAVVSQQQSLGINPKQVRTGMNGVLYSTGRPMQACSRLAVSISTLLVRAAIRLCMLFLRRWS